MLITCGACFAARAERMGSEGAKVEDRELESRQILLSNQRVTPLHFQDEK